MKDRTNLTLLLLLILSVIACAVIWSENPPLVLSLSCIPFFALQLLLLRLSKRRIIRLLPIRLVLLAAVIGLLLRLFGESMTPLLGLILMWASAAPAVGILLAWLLLRFPSRRAAQTNGE